MLSPARVLTPPGARPWQQELRLAFRALPELLAHLQLRPEDVDALPAGAGSFPLLVPRPYAARMRPGDPHDPLLRQVLPLRAELRRRPGDLIDPVGDRASERSPGLLHKYRGRALLISTGACAVHCRYCFRQHFPYGESNPSRDEHAGLLAALRSDPSIEELILSGGDPLSLADSRLRRLTDRLAEVDSLRRLRLHTRWPVVLPARVDSGLLDWLGALPWPVTVVLHANHPAEIDAEVAAACARLRATGALLLNQSVLLAGVNDDTAVLAELSTRLHDAGVLPYYLHLLDAVAGAAHFRVGERRGRALVRALRQRLPGYLVPRLAREVEGESAKRVLAG